MVDTINDNDLRNLESLLSKWSEKAPSDADLSSYVLDDRAIEALTKSTIGDFTSLPGNEMNFMFTPSSPSSSSLTSSPMSSPLYNPPSSPSSNEFNFPVKDFDSSGDEFEQNFFSNESNSIPSWNTCDLTTGMTDANNSFHFDGSAVSNGNPGFSMTYMPPLPSVSQPAPAMDNNSKNTESGQKTKKRRRQNEGKPSINAKLSELSEEQLLLFDSNEIEQYIKNLTASRNISPSEEKNLKKIRRLIKNREYAQSSRNKKKAYVDEIEAKLNVAEQEKAALMQRVNALENENKNLKYHLARILKNSGRAISNNKNSFTSLFVIVFCFGLFAFGGYSIGNNGRDSITTDVRMFRNTEYKTGRIILSIEEQDRDLPLLKKYTPVFIQELLDKNNFVEEEIPKMNNLEKHVTPTITYKTVPQNPPVDPANTSTHTLEQVCNEKGECQKPASKAEL